MKRALIFVVLLLVVGLVVWDPLFPAASQFAYWRIKVPRTRDSRLMGKWNGRWKFMDETDLRPRSVVFNGNGTAHTFEPNIGQRPFEWGTQDGVLYTRRMATDAWSGTQRSYTLSADGRKITFSKDRMFDLVTQKMERQ